MMGEFQTMLRGLATEMDRMRRQLEALIAIAPEGEAGAAPAASERDGEPEPTAAAAFLDAILQSRRALERAMGSEAFGDPRRDMLIELYRASLVGRQVSISELGIAAGVPHATALRHIQALVDEGMVGRTPDPRDARRTYLHLLPAAEHTMRDWTLSSRDAVQKAIA